LEPTRKWPSTLVASTQLGDQGPTIQTFAVFPSGVVPDAEADLPASIRITILGPVLMPILRRGVEPIPMRRVGPNEWEFSLSKVVSGSDLLDFRIDIPCDPDFPLCADQIQVSWLPSNRYPPIFDAFAGFHVRRNRAAHEAIGQRPGTFGDYQRIARHVFPEIDLLFLFRALEPWDGAPEQTKAKILDHFRGHKSPEVFAQVLDAFPDADGMNQVVLALKLRSESRLKAWAQGREPAPLGAWADVKLTEQQALLLAKSIASIFLQHCRLGPDQRLDVGLARRVVLMFASGLARMGDDATFDQGGAHFGEAFNAEPNSAQFRAFAEVADLFRKHLAARLDSEEQSVWDAIFPALVLGIELFARAYEPYPVDSENCDNEANPGVLQRILENGRDPRPDPELLERALRRVGYFAGEDEHFRPQHGIEPFWGALLWNLKLRKSTGVLPSVEHWNPVAP